MIRKEYPVLNNWLMGIYWKHSSYKDTTDFKHIKENVSLQTLGYLFACGKKSRTYKSHF